MKKGSLNFFARLKRAERKTLVWWIKFARVHRYSVRLPIILFLVLFLDGFLIFIPSTLCLMVAVTISPQRWWIYGLIFAAAATSNNSVTYAIGRSVSPEAIVEFFSYIHLTDLWFSARAALEDYGAYATFVGAIIGLPTQLITALIGTADAKSLVDNPDGLTQFGRALSFAFAGHGLKALLIAGLTRYGWLKLEKKFG